jgi:hypothetical protein
MNELERVIRTLEDTASPTVADLHTAAATLSRCPTPRPYAVALALYRLAVLLEARTRVDPQVPAVAWRRRQRPGVCGAPAADRR